VEHTVSEDSGEYSVGGVRILRHGIDDEDEQELRPPEYAHHESISQHISAAIGPIELVYHELVSHFVHVDVHWVKATESRPFHVLVTSGMSALPMTLPEGLPFARHAELMALLPESWKLQQDAWRDERWYWPIRWLKILARLPHEHQTWLGSGHTVPNGDPPEPFAPDTSLCCMLLAKATSLPPEAQSMTLPDGSPLEFFALYPLHENEMLCKLVEGTDALLDKLDAARVSDVIDPLRPSVAGPPPRKKRRSRLC
jgi:hypothetical protein